MTIPKATQIAALTFLAALATTASARADDVSLDNVVMKPKEGGVVSIRHVDVLGTNLSKAEVAKLFDAATSKEDGRAIVAKMRASRVSIPDVKITSKDGAGAVHDIQMRDIDSGKVAAASMASLDFSQTGGENAPTTVKLGPVAVEGADFSKLLEVSAAGGDVGKVLQEGQWGRFTKFDMRDLDVSATDKDVQKAAPGGNVFHVTLASATGTAVYSGAVPTTQKFELKNLVIMAPKASDMGQQLAAIGYDKLDLGMTIAATYDPAGKKLGIDDMTVSGVGLGSFGMKGAFNNIDAGFFNGDQTARMQQIIGGTVSGVDLAFTNAGLFERGLAFYAKQQGKTADAVKKEWGNAANMMAPMLLQGDPVGVKIAEAVNKFLAKPGTFKLGAKAKAAPLGAADFLTVSGPQDILPKIDVTVSAN